MGDDDFPETLNARDINEGGFDQPRHCKSVNLSQNLAISLSHEHAARCFVRDDCRRSDSCHKLVLARILEVLKRSDCQLSKRADQAGKRVDVKCNRIDEEVVNTVQ